MKLIKVGIMTLALAGLLALPLEEASARTRCHTTTVNGHVVKRVCTTTGPSRSYRQAYRPYRPYYQPRYSHRAYPPPYYRAYPSPYYRAWHPYRPSRARPRPWYYD